jgi:hypothetical protein
MYGNSTSVVTLVEAPLASPLGRIAFKGGVVMDTSTLVIGVGSAEDSTTGVDEVFEKLQAREAAMITIKG